MKKDLDIFGAFCYYMGKAIQEETMTMSKEREMLERAVFALDTLISTQPDSTYYTAEFEHADAISEEIWEYLREAKND